jgi:shikimate kinase
MAPPTHQELAQRLQGLNIYLVGMMGAGKSAVGRPLADALGYRFVDADTVLEGAAGRTIAEIFACDGELAFRQLETTVLGQISGWHSLVVATGGGVVTRPENWGHMRQGVVVWLDAPAEQLLARLRLDPTPRPLLQSKDPACRLQQLLAERQPLYAQADLHVLQQQEQPPQVAQLVLESLPGILRERPEAPRHPALLQNQVGEITTNLNEVQPDPINELAPQAPPGGSSRTANHCTLRPGSSSS